MSEPNQTKLISLSDSDIDDIGKIDSSLSNSSVQLALLIRQQREIESTINNLFVAREKIVKAIMDRESIPSEGNFVWNIRRNGEKDYTLIIETDNQHS